MSYRFARAKRDATHAPAMEAFHKAGWSVADTAAVGDGFADFIAARFGFVVLVEMKSRRDDVRPEAPSSRKQPRKNQRAFADRWHGWYIVAHDAVEALRTAEAARRYEAEHGPTTHAARARLLERLRAAEGI